MVVVVVDEVVVGEMLDSTVVVGEILDSIVVVGEVLDSTVAVSAVRLVSFLASNL